MTDRESKDDPSDSETAKLFHLVYEALHQLALGYLRRERKGHTLQPTALVHEVFLKLDRPEADFVWNGKTHFKAVAARAMRQILVDHARERSSKKRGGNWQRVTLSAAQIVDQPNVDFVALNEALTELSKQEIRKSQVVELKFFGGMTTAEAAEQLGISPKTAESDWYFARAWLRRKLSEEVT